MLTPDKENLPETPERYAVPGVRSFILRTRQQAGTLFIQSASAEYFHAELDL